MASWTTSSIAPLAMATALPGNHTLAIGQPFQQNGVDMTGGMVEENNKYNKTMNIIKELRVKEVRLLRVMHIGFGSFSCLMALLVIFRIWYDSWRAHKLNPQRGRKRFDFLFHLHPAESFPLLLAFIILFQEFQFVGIQATSLNNIFVRKCRIGAQVVFSQIFTIGWFHMSFGFDMTIRALKKGPLIPCRRRWQFALCFFGAWILTVATWLATRLQLPGNKCYGDMIWRTLKSSLLGIVLAGFMIPTLLLMALIIYVRLHNAVLMDHNERIAGTRMVYYLVLSAILYIFVIPFWIQAITSTFDKGLSSSRVAEFILFIEGAVIAFVHFFLRANAARTAIRPKKACWDNSNRKFRMFGPSDLELMNISAPLQYNAEDKLKISPWDTESALSKAGMLPSPPMTPTTVGSRNSMAIAPKASQMAVHPSWPLPEPGQAFTSPKKETVLEPVPTTSPQTPQQQSKRATYSLFPGPESADDLRLPPTVYSPDKKSSPTKLSTKPQDTLASISESRNYVQPPSGPRHRRTSTAGSSATVQIGIRFSNAPAAVAAAQSRPSNSQTRPSLKSIIDSINSNQNQNPFADKPLPQPQYNATALQESPFDDDEEEKPEPVMAPRQPHRMVAEKPSLSTIVQSPAPSRSLSNASTSTTAMTSPSRPSDSNTRMRDTSPSSESYATSDTETLSATTYVPSPSRALRSNPSVSSIKDFAPSSPRTPRGTDPRRIRLAESNREEMKKLERSGSGAKVRVRPAYPRVETPDGNDVRERYF